MPVAFLSPQFFLFFPIVVLVYFLLPQDRLRNGFLLLASLFFYLCAGPQGFSVLLCVIAVTYGGGRLLERGRSRHPKLVLAVLLVLILGALCTFKYLNSIVQTVGEAVRAAGFDFASPAMELILPLGISFYMLSAAGYLIDVYRGKTAAEHNFVTCALVISFFPALLSGPIARFGDLAPQFAEHHSYSYFSLRRGLLRFLWGAAKKLVIADRLALLVAAVYDAPQTFGTMQVAAAIVAFTVQLYCDFSAYSDMALGAADAMGFRLKENFKTPFFARSIGEFWRRWHISLSTWFRDYLYIPLGGNRVEKWRKYLNVLIVFGISGLWHGGAVTFLTWGLLNGVYQVAGELTLPARRYLHRFFAMKEGGKPLAVVQILLTFSLTCIAFSFFRADSMEQAGELFKSLFAGPLWLVPPSTIGLDYLELRVVAVALLVLLIGELWFYFKDKKLSCWSYLISRPRAVRWCLALGLLMVIFVFGIYGEGYDPRAFIYFKF